MSCFLVLDISGMLHCSLPMILVIHCRHALKIENGTRSLDADLARLSLQAQSRALRPQMYGKAVHSMPLSFAHCQMISKHDPL